MQNTSPTVSGADAVLLHTYNRQPLAFTHGQGATLYDSEGRAFIDFCSGIATSSLGHGHAELRDAIAEQAGKLIHVSNLYEIPEQVDLARQLRAFTGYERYFFCNSGTEANEAMIKLARAWGKPRGRDRIIVARQGFHGRTLGALSATGQPAMQAPFEPLLSGFDQVDFGEIASIERTLSDRTAAVYLEPVQAEGGGRFPPQAYLGAVRELCDNTGALLLLDEVQMGLGRCGYPLAQDAYGIRADAVALAKGLGGGVPIGALAVTEALADVLGPGMHGSTFGGNPLACRAAAVVIETLQTTGVLERIQAAGERLLQVLREFPNEIVAEPRGLGLFVCFRAPDNAAFVAAARDHGLLVVGAKDNVVRLLPPLLIRDSELDDGIERLRATVKACAA